MELEVRHLRVLCAIADAGSVAQAAKAMGYSQQGLSTQLRRIEHHFGRRLFDRSSVGVVPTGYGAEIIARGRDIIGRVDTIGRPTGSPAETIVNLRLAATNTPLLAGTAGRLKAQLPGVAMTVRSVYSSAEEVSLLEAGQLDAAIAADYPGLELQHSSTLTHRGIATEPTFVALPARHRLHDRIEVMLSDLASEHWFLTPDDGAGWPGIFHAACRSAGFTPTNVHEYLGDRVQLQRMISEGLGISPVQATFRPDDGVVVKPLTGTPLWCRYVLVWRQNDVPGTAIEALFAAASSAYRDLIAGSAAFQSWAVRTYKTSDARRAAPTARP